MKKCDWLLCQEYLINPVVVGIFVLLRKAAVKLVMVVHQMKPLEKMGREKVIFLGTNFFKQIITADNERKFAETNMDLVLGLLNDDLGEKCYC